MVTASLNAQRRTLRVKIKGDVLSTNAEAHAGAITEIFEHHKGTDISKFNLDLRTAQMVDSVGLNMILGLVRFANERRFTTKIAIASPAVHRVFQFSRLNKAVEVVFKERGRRGT